MKAHERGSAAEKGTVPAGRRFSFSPSRYQAIAGRGEMRVQRFAEENFSVAGIADCDRLRPLIPARVFFFDFGFQMACFASQIAKAEQIVGQFQRR